jgi:hypothetical protein
MRTCNDYEIELSALLDGECDPAGVIDLMDHVTTCSECSSFYLELRSFQETVDGAELMPSRDADSVSSAEPERKAGFLSGWIPNWGLGVAAVAVVTVVAAGLWFGGAFNSNSGDTTPVEMTGSADVNPDGIAAGEPSDEEVKDAAENVMITLGENSGQMDEERFIELVTEILRADRRYQEEMYVVLDQVTQDSMAEEGGGALDVEGSDTEGSAMGFSTFGQSRMMN